MSVQSVLAVVPKLSVFGGTIEYMARRLDSTPLVGRVDEVRRLRAVLDETAEGRPSIALVGGDAGVGKTRLVSEVAAQATAAGFVVLTGQCVELGGGGLPYLPFVDALRRPADPRAARLVASAVERHPALARMLGRPDPARPAQGAAVAPPVGPPAVHAAPEGASTDEALGQVQLFAAVLALLSDLSAEAPVLLVIEDIHWADRSTRDLIAFLTRTMRWEPVTVLATYRADDLHRRHPLRPLLSELSRLPGVERVDLGALPHTEMAALVAALSDDQLDARAQERLVRRADGNAFFAEELVTACRETHAGRGAGDLPTVLSDVLLGRVERLSETTQQVLRVASVAGRRVRPELLVAAADLPADVVEEATREAVTHQVLVADGDTVAFRHALLQEAVYSDLLPGERTRLHATYARLFDRPGDSWSEHSYADLAHHHLASHDIPAALVASVRAAAEAERMAAPPEAARHLELALALWERVADAETLVGEPRYRLVIRAAAATAATGDLSRASAMLRSAVDALDALDDATCSGAAAPEVFAELLERYAYYELDADDKAAALAAVTRAVKLTEGGPATALRARVLAGRARALVGADRFGEARSVALEALEVARAAGSLDNEAEAMVTLGLITEHAGDTAEAVELFDRACALAAEAGNIAVELRARYHRAGSPFDRGDLSAALEHIQLGTAAANDAGMLWSAYGLSLHVALFLLLFMRGEWAAADELRTTFGDRLSNPSVAVMVALSTQHLVAVGSPEARGQLGALTAFSDDPWVAHLAGVAAEELALWEGDLDAVQAAVDRAFDVIRKRWHADALAIVRHAATGLTATAEAAARARLVDDQAALARSVARADQLLEAAERAMAGGGGRTSTPGAEARAWALRAAAEHARTVGADDPERWREVVVAFSYGDVYETARARLRLAASLVAAGDREGARAEWAAAHESAELLGAAPLLHALADLARRGRLDADAAAAPSVGSLSLTPRELEVLRLVAGGRSNKQIGTELFISVKTASVHVSNLMAKLGATSRTEAAAIAFRSGLLDDQAVR